MAEKVKQHRYLNDPIALDEFKSFSWAATTHLRDQIDAVGYKEYIFLLFFFKRISDVYDEQSEGFVHEGRVEYIGKQVEDLPIRIPEGAYWRDAREVAENVGNRLVEALTVIKQANPTKEMDGREIGGLEEIFGPKDGWTNKAKMLDSITTSLIEDSSRHTPSLKAYLVSEMGQTYEYLVGKFANDAGNIAQEFYTSRTVVQLMAEILQPQPNESIYGPTRGSGGMSVKCSNYLRNKGDEWQSVQVLGQEVNGLASLIARMNLYLSGVEDLSIVCVDTLEHPAFLDGSHLRKLDIVLANPLYSIKEWNREKFIDDKWGRNFSGMSPQEGAGYALIQRILTSMNKKNGRCVILPSHGILFRREEKDIRKSPAPSDSLEAVIGLGPNLFYNSPMGACILFCNKNKPRHLRDKITFINTINEVTRENGESYPEGEHIKKILSAFYSNGDIPQFKETIDINDICNNEYDISIQKYVFINDLKEYTDCRSAFESWQNIKVEFHNSVEVLLNMIQDGKI